MIDSGVGAVVSTGTCKLAPAAATVREVILDFARLLAT